MALAWILTRKGRYGKWHAWPHGARHSLCGRVTVETLRTKPAAEIATEAPSAEDARLCVTCASRSKHLPQLSHPDPCVRAWVYQLRMYLRHHHMTIAAPTLTLLAERLAELGLPETAEASAAFQELQSFLLRPQYQAVAAKHAGTRRVATLPHLKDAISKLPAQQAALSRIAHVLRLYKLITQRDIALDRYRVDRVTETMLQIPQPEPYIRHLHSRSLSHLAAMFHPNTLERAKRDTALRGVFSSGSSTYWDRTSSQINVVTD